MPDKHRGGVQFPGGPPMSKQRRDSQGRLLLEFRCPCGKRFWARPRPPNKSGKRYCSLVCYGRLRDFSGSKNPNWRGGSFQSGKGYWYVHMPDHHRAMKNGYVKRADVVAEKKIGRKLLPNEVVHHEDSDPSNDSLDNLVVKDSLAHIREHAVKRRKPKKSKKARKSVCWPSDSVLLEMAKTMTQRQMATLLGCSQPAVFYRLHRSRR